MEEPQAVPAVTGDVPSAPTDASPDSSEASLAPACPPVRSLCGGLTCSLCHRLYTEPVELSGCQHFYCRACIIQHCQENGPSCPECGGDCNETSYKTNPLLTGLLECLKLQGTGIPQGPLCTEHGKKLERYCVTDSEVICLDCRDSRKHLYHEVLNTQEAAEEFKEQLKKSLKDLEAQRLLHTSSQTSCEAQLEDIASKAQLLEEQIKSSFEKLHAFLREEESALLQELHKEEDVLRQNLGKRIAQLSEAVQKLSSGLQEVEKSLQQEDTLSFLQNFRTTQDRTIVPPVNVDRTPLELKEENYTGPVQFWVWKKMLKVLDVAPEIMKLDQNTASPFLVITDSVKVRCGDKKRPVPDGPERFDPAACVLGASGFDQGCHYWEVMVGQKSEWGLGVAKESVTRKGEIMLCPDNGFWAVVRNGKDYRAFTLPPTPLPLERKPQRVGVYLDYEKGQVSFYDPDKMAHFHTFSGNFSEKVYPFFFTGVKEGKGEPLRILQFRL
ncbi:zinc-binding protein A33-like [Ambystoma mexicanum]|uniref:zinc-binding protein A33-like n=1 Tax=Ambystoma mexicanum TaxID=8296 RepID=UPI0037E8CDA4